MAANIETTISLELVACYTCGVIWGVPQQLDQNRHDDKAAFFCPHGHSQSYTGKPVRDQLSETKRVNERLQLERDVAQSDAARKGAQLTSLKRRMKKLKSQSGRKAT